MSTSDIETRLFYGGQFHASLSGKTFPIYDPSKPTEITAHVHEAFKEDVDAAVAAAKEAQPAWAATSPLEKQRLMNLLADRIMEPSTLKRLNELEARTMGYVHVRTKDRRIEGAG